MKRHLGLILLCLNVAAGCIEGPPESPASNASTNNVVSDAGLDAGEDLDAGESTDMVVASDVDVPDMGGDDVGSTDMDVDPPLQTKRTLTGLEFYVPLRDSGVARFRDISGAGELLRTEGNATVSSQGLSVDDGTTAFISEPFTTQMSQTIADTDEFTIEFWMAAGFNDNSNILAFSGIGLQEVKDADSPHFPIQVRLGDDVYEVAGALTEDEPEHVVLRGRNGMIHLYLNGSLVAGWVGENIAELFQKEPGNFVMGGSATMTFSLLAIYSRALTEGEIMSHAFAGPHPPEESEVRRPLAEAVASTDENGLGGDRRTRQVTIVEDPERQQVALYPSPNANALLWLEVAPPHDAAPVYSRFIAKASTNERAGSLTTWTIQRPWDANVSWLQATVDESWTSPGAIGEGDRVEPALDQRSIGLRERALITVDITPAMNAWLDDESRQNGLFFGCDTCAFELLHSADYTSALRHRYQTLYTTTSPGPEPTAPSQLIITPKSPTVAEFTWPEQDHDVELYIDGRLRKRTHLSSTALEGLPEDGFEAGILSVDEYGRRSPVIRAMP